MSSIFEHETVSSVLTHELDRRKRRNQSYSLRAFASSLGISVSRLSEVMKGSHGLSEKMASTLAVKMKLKQEETKYWYDLVLSESSRSIAVRNLARQRLINTRNVERIQEIKEDQFRVISDWYHAALLELTQIQSFQKDIQWISKKLGITAQQTSDAIQRLQNLGLLKITESGDWNVNPEAYSVFSPTPSSAIRKFLRQILQNGIDSIQSDSPEDREMQAMILAMPKSRLPEFRQKIKSYLHQMWQDLGDEPKDELYSFSIQLIPVRNRKRQTNEFDS